MWSSQYWPSSYWGAYWTVAAESAGNLKASGDLVVLGSSELTSVVWAKASATASVLGSATVTDANAQTAKAVVGAGKYKYRYEEEPIAVWIKASASVSVNATANPTSVKRVPSRNAQQWLMLQTINRSIVNA